MVEVWTLVVIENMAANKEVVIKELKKFLWKNYRVPVVVFPCSGD